MECPACHTENIENAKFCAKCGAEMPAESSETDPLIGRNVKNTFLLKRLLGEGGMGKVYEAEQRMGNTDRKVAVKTLHTDLSRDPSVVKRFYRECEVVVQLEHPNTIKFYDFGEIEDDQHPNEPKQLFIAMEFLNGESVESVLQREGKFTPDRVINIMKQVCGSLKEAHSKGVIHRDLKPDNVQLTNRAGVEDFVKVLDFGIAHKDAGSKKEQKLTQQGMVLGTPPYMSPEQFTGKQLDGRSDIYSLGVMTYEMLTGRLPLEAETPWEWATKHLTEQPYPFEVTAPRDAIIPEHMKAAIMRALSKNRDDRQQDVGQYLEELEGKGGMASAGTPIPTSGGGATGTTAMEAPPPEILQAAASHPGGGPAPMAAPPPVTPPTPAGAYGAPPVAPAMAPAPQRESGGGGKGLLIGAAVVGGIGVIAGAVFIFLGLRGPGGDDTDATLTGVIPSATGVASVESVEDSDSGGAAAAPKETSTAAATVKTTGPRPTHKSTGKKPPKKKEPQGEAACLASATAARTGSIVYAVSLYRVCTSTGGRTGGQAKAAIRTNAGSAARRARFNHKCAKARQIARAAGSIGADGGSSAEARQCK